jgi:RNA polymerase sigma factor (TIGR02999 family)
VNEAYLRLRKQGAQQFENRAHFLAIAAQLMRQILVEYARYRNAEKRDARGRLTLDDTVQLLKAKSVDLVALDDALGGLAKLDPRQSRVVELRFFGGLSTDEISSVLGVSRDTVKRDWATAKIWLYREMTRIA